MIIWQGRGFDKREIRQRVIVRMCVWDFWAGFEVRGSEGGKMNGKKGIAYFFAGVIMRM